MDVKREAQERSLAEITKSRKGMMRMSGCKSWYQTAEGINFAIWPKSTWRYWLETRRVRVSDFEWVRPHAPLGLEEIESEGPRKRPAIEPPRHSVTRNERQRLHCFAGAAGTWGDRR